MNQSTKSTIIWVTAGVLIAGAIITAALLSSKSSTPSTPLDNNGNTTSGTLQPPVSSSDWTKGSENPVVTLVEYSDFQCPACANAEPIIVQLVNEFGDHMQFVYRHYPLRSIHPNAQMSAQAAEAAGKQGKFWEMHDMLFDKQQEWSSMSTSQAKTAFSSYAAEIGLDVNQFNTDIDSKEVKDIVNASYDSATKAGLGGTPSFFLNGEVLRNPGSLDGFRTVIRNAINEQ